MEKFDVVVIGGGLSGAAAAASAAKLGRRTLLVERHRVFGGNATVSLVGPLQTFHAPRGRVIGGFAQELVDNLAERGGTLGHIPDPIGFVSTVTPVDSELLKITLFDMLEKADVTMMTGYRFIAAGVAPDGRVEFVRLLAGNGEEVSVRGDVFVDASGNGDLTAAAGCEMEIDPDCQPMTLMFRVGGVKPDDIVKYVLAHPEEFHAHPDPAVIKRGYIGVSGFFRHVERAAAEGRFDVPRDRLLMFGTTSRDEVTINTTRISGLSGLDAGDMSYAAMEGHRQVYQVFELLKNDIPGFENCRITAIAAEVGVRETRRLLGRYILNENDLVAAARFDDVVAKGAYPLDIHMSTGAGLSCELLGGGGFYDIPLRSLLNKNATNLVTVGKCLSVTHKGFSSTRVMPTSMAVGQGGGVAAALMASDPGGDAEDLTSKIQDALLRQRAVLRDDQVK